MIISLSRKTTLAAKWKMTCEESDQQQGDKPKSTTVMWPRGGQLKAGQGSAERLWAWGGLLEVKLEGLADGLDKGKFLDLVTVLALGLQGGMSGWYICYYGKYWKEVNLNKAVIAPTQFEGIKTNTIY